MNDCTKCGKWFHQSCYDEDIKAKDWMCEMCYNPDGNKINSLPTEILEKIFCIPFVKKEK